MPLPYTDSTGWILWYTSPNSEFRECYISFVRSRPCPVEVATNNRTTGAVGGRTIEQAVAEAEVWRTLYPEDYQNIINSNRTFVFYNYDTAEVSEVVPFRVRVRLSPLIPEEESRKKKMIKLKFARESGKLVLSVNATGLHETLDAIGCRTQTAGGITRYESRPHAPHLIADTAGNTLSTEIFLVKPPEGKTESVYNLSELYTRPPSLDQLRRLANSANEKARAILEHYQPVDIQVSIQKKLIG